MALLCRFFVEAVDSAEADKRSLTFEAKVSSLAPGSWTRDPLEPYWKRPGCFEGALKLASISGMDELSVLKTLAEGLGSPWHWKLEGRCAIFAAEKSVMVPAPGIVWIELDLD